MASERGEDQQIAATYMQALTLWGEQAGSDLAISQRQLEEVQADIAVGQANVTKIGKFVGMLPKATANFSSNLNHPNEITSIHFETPSVVTASAIQAASIWNQSGTRPYYVIGQRAADPVRTKAPAREVLLFNPYETANRYTPTAIVALLSQEDMDQRQDIVTRIRSTELDREALESRSNVHGLLKIDGNSPGSIAIADSFLNPRKVKPGQATPDTVARDGIRFAHLADKKAARANGRGPYYAALMERGISADDWRTFEIVQGLGELAVLFGKEAQLDQLLAPNAALTTPQENVRALATRAGQSLTNFGRRLLG